jgi:hypothetical protein
MTTIEGKARIAAHGESKMPVWGEIFEKEADRQKNPTAAAAESQSNCRLPFNDSALTARAARLASPSSSESLSYRYRPDTLTSICLGFACSAFGKFSVSTPYFRSAEILL